MKTSTGFAALGLVAALATAPLAWAQGATGGAGSAPATSASPASGGFVGRHTMTGEVTKVDSSSGKFSLKTGEGTLELHAPPSALAGVKQGDRMSVEIAVKPMK
jgi:hypothetical protein